jgi:hypothetical protein
MTITRAIVATAFCIGLCAISVSSADRYAFSIDAELPGVALATSFRDHRAALPRSGASPSGADSLSGVPWPDGTQVLRFEDLEGAILVPAILHQPPARDTSGVFVLDTGAGFLGLDRDLARILGIVDEGAAPPAIDLAPRALARLELGTLQIDQVSPVLTVDAEVIRRVTGRPVLGLLGQALFKDRVVILDFREGTLVVLPPEPRTSAGADPTARREPVPTGADSSGWAGAAPGGPARANRPTAPPPSLASALSHRAVAIPFRLAGDGKILVEARVTGSEPGAAAEPLILIVDTGATKSVLFGDALSRRLPRWTAWRALRGLSAPTLTGDARAVIVRVPRISLEEAGRVVARQGVDAAVLRGDLGRVLSSDVGEPVDGLLGYSFLKHYRLALDFPRSLLWLDPEHGDLADRPFEYSSVGLQLESAAGRTRVLSVAAGSPAEGAGLREGDDLVAIDGDQIAGSDIVEVSRRLEGPPGTRLTLTVRRGSREWRVRLARRQLL